MQNRVCLTIEDGVAHVPLNRPDKVDARDPAMVHSLIEAGTSLGAQGDVRAGTQLMRHLAREDVSRKILPLALSETKAQGLGLVVSRGVRGLSSRVDPTS